MFTPDNLNKLFREVMAQMGAKGEDKSICRKENANNQGSQCNQNGYSCQENQNGGSKIAINPSQALVIAGILGGVLDVFSVLVDKEQGVQILLVGSLKQKTQLEKMFDQIGAMPFDDVLNALLGRLT